MGPLIEVADIDDEIVGVFRAPAEDLIGATREPSEAFDSFVVLGGQNMPMDISGVEDRDGLKVVRGGVIQAQGARFEKGQPGGRDGAGAGPAQEGATGEGGGTREDLARIFLFGLRTHD